MEGALRITCPSPRPLSLRVLGLVAACVLTAGLGGCSSTPTNPNPRAAEALKPASVDLPKYMGRWYVIANIPNPDENGYVAGQADWTLRGDGRIDGAYLGRKGGFDAPESRREYTTTVVPGTGNAHWRVRRFWLFGASRLTLYVDPMYQYTVVGYPDKSLGWILARTPFITGAKYQELLGKLDEQGFDLSRIRRVPQQREQVGKPGFHSPGNRDQ